MGEFNILTALLGGLVLLLGLASRRLARSPFPPSLIALAAGMLAGPAALGLVDVAALGEEPVIREKIARLALGIALVGVALRIPRSFPRQSWRPMLLLVLVAMPLMWAISTGLTWLVLGTPLWLSAVIGAAITPTDPVAATPIVTGDLAEENIPQRLRDAVSLESGLNDGAAYILVFLAFFMLTMPADEAISKLFVETFLWEVAGATAFGIALGWMSARLLRLAEGWRSIEDDWRLVYTVALALLAVGAGKLIHSDEVLVAFAAGAAFVQVVSAEDREHEDHGQEAVNRFFVVGIFALIGLTAPWEGWADLGWRGPALAVLVLLLRRPPVILMLRPGLSFLKGTREALFVGWFGPIAVAAMYYASMMEHRLGAPIVWHVVSLVICASVVAHGMTGAALTRALGRDRTPRPARPRPRRPNG